MLSTIPTGEGRSMPVLRRLRQVRERQYLSQEDLAKRSGVSRVSISKLESGRVNARFVTIRKLAAALGADPDDLVGDNEHGDS
jgi:transcriptional regulator with XRE-family HTH domain